MLDLGSIAASLLGGCGAHLLPRQQLFALGEAHLGGISFLSAVTVSSYSLDELKVQQEEDTQAWVEGGTDVCWVDQPCVQLSLPPLLGQRTVNHRERWGGYSNSSVEIFLGVFPLAKE